MASLELNKIYKTHPDDNAAELGLVRIVDESGEDYLYPQEYFAILPKDAFCSMHFSQDERSKILHSLMPAWPGTYAVSVAWASRPCVTGASCPCFFYFFANPWLPRKQPRCSHATQRRELKPKNNFVNSSTIRNNNKYSVLQNRWILDIQF